MEFSEELVGGSTNAFNVSTNGVSNTVSGYSVTGSTVTLTLGTVVNPGDETQVSYATSTATLKDVDEGGKTVSFAASTVATYAVDDQPSLTSAKVTGTNTVTLEFSEELVEWFNECICGVNEWCEQHGEWVHGEWINGDVDVGYGCELWR